MKIDKVFLFIVFCFSSVQVKSTGDENKEIIGSGLFNINDNRSFTIDNNSVIHYDDEVIGYDLFEIIGSGFRSVVTLDDGVDERLEQGLVSSLSLVTNLRGPVTSLEPLEILQQPVLLTSDTVNDLNVPIELYQSLAVSGYLSTNNSHKVTKLMLNDRPQQWKVRGFVSDIIGSSFKIGELSIEVNDAHLLNCQRGMHEGARVEVLFAPDINYDATGSIKSTLSVECLFFNQLSDDIRNLPTVIQGFVTEYSNDGFWMDDIYVNTSIDTLFENGDQRFINSTVNLEVQGLLDVESSTIEAHLVHFIDTRIELIIPLGPENIGGDQNLTVNGVTYHKTPQTLDDLQILEVGIDNAQQIQILGYTDGEDNVYISRLIDKGEADFNEVSLRGSVSAIDKPFLTVLNFEIDTSNSPLFDPSSTMVNADDFFELIEVGSQIEIDNAKLDVFSGKLIDSKVEIRQVGKRQVTYENREIIGSGITEGYVTATISSSSVPVEDLLFVCDFERE